MSPCSIHERNLALVLKRLRGKRHVGIAENDRFRARRPQLFDGESEDLDTRVRDVAADEVAEDHAIDLLCHVRRRPDQFRPALHCGRLENSAGGGVASTKNADSFGHWRLFPASFSKIEKGDRDALPCARTVEMGLSVVLASGKPLLSASESPHGAVMAILFGSDHSLCGGFNEFVVNFASTEHRDLSAQKPWHWLAVGTRAAHSLEIAGHTIGHSISLPGTSSGLIETSHRILLTIDDWRARREVTRVLFFHNRRREKAATPHRVQLLPLDRKWLNELAQRPWSQRTTPTFTMESSELFSALAREHLFANIFRSGAESLASEHATRLAAMQAALRNIEEHLEEMTAGYRRKRQDAIASELLDIVAGYETLRDVPRAGASRRRPDS